MNECCSPIGVIAQLGMETPLLARDSSKAARVADHLRADLDKLFTQAGQRPILARFRRRQRAQEIAEIVGERVKLKPNLIAEKEGHDSRVHRIAPLPSLIHCSQVPRLLQKATTLSAGRAMLVTMKPIRG
jgi:hypothetical protein